MPRRGYSKWSFKKLLAVGAMVTGLSGFLGSSLGTYFPRNPPPVPISRIVLINNYQNGVERRDVTAELIPILQRLANKQITLNDAIAEIGKILPIRQLGEKFIENIKPILIPVIEIGSDEEIQKAVAAIADALEKSSAPSPTPLQRSPFYVRPSP